MMEKQFLVGSHAHGKKYIKALHDLGVGNFIWIPKKGYGMGFSYWNDENTILDDVDECIRNDMYFMISQRRGIGDKIRCGGFPYGGDCSGDIYSETETKEILNHSNGYFVGFHGEELDADLIQSSLHFISRERTPELYNYTDRMGGRKSFQGELSRLADRYHSWGVNFLPNLCVTYQHCGFRSTSDIVLAEPLEHLVTTELQLAYLRGGSWQFNKPFGIWVSPWLWDFVPNYDKKLWTGPNSDIGKGHEVSEFRRVLYLSLVSGCRVFTMQETEPLLCEKNGELELAPWGEELKQLWDMVKDDSQEYRPIIKTAILIDENNGWAPAHLWQNWNRGSTVWGTLQPTTGDKMLSEYLHCFLPGYERTDESVKAKSDIYPGFFADSPMGAFDIITSDIALDKMKKYSNIITLGDIDMTDELYENIKAYVINGGNVLLSYEQLLHNGEIKKDADILGVKIINHMFFDTCVKPVNESGLLQKEYISDTYTGVEVELENATVIATNQSGYPVLTHNRLGNGNVYFSTIEHMLGGFGQNSSKLSFFSEFLKLNFSNNSIKIEGNVSWCAAHHGNNTVIVICNHTSDNQTVRITLPKHFTFSSGDNQQDIEISKENIYITNIGGLI